MLRKRLRGVSNNLTNEDFSVLAEKSDGYSGADMTGVCREAAIFPLRELQRKLGPSGLETVDASSIRPVNKKDVLRALQTRRPSVSASELLHYIQWNKDFGTIMDEEEDRQWDNEEDEEGVVLEDGSQGEVIPQPE
jgi:SpoVK/Ycf46/Vps4 family AAA+-type ATPase